MRYRIATWAGVGLLFAVGWLVYALVAGPSHNLYYSGPIIWTLLGLSCPVAVASFYFHFPLSVYASFVVNAATYALVGLIVESLRHTPTDRTSTQHLRTL
jgi:hypothetical protein